MNYLYILTLWQGIERAEQAGYLSFATALRTELAAELLKADRKTFFRTILSI